MPHHLVLFGKRGPKTLQVTLFLSLGPRTLTLWYQILGEEEREGWQQRNPKALDKAWGGRRRPEVPRPGGGSPKKVEGCRREVEGRPGRARKGEAEPSGGQWVCPSGSGSTGRMLFGSFGLSPVGFAIHLVVRAFASAFPGHSARHDKRQVPTPGGRGRVRGPAAWPQNSSHVPKRSLQGNWVPNIPQGKARRGPQDRTALREPVIKASALANTLSKNRQEAGTEEKGTGTRIDGVVFCKMPPCAQT